MSKLTSAERKARDNERFSQRVNDRREKGEDVVAYALTNKKAVKFLTKSEKNVSTKRERPCKKRSEWKNKKSLTESKTRSRSNSFDDE